MIDNPALSYMEITPGTLNSSVELYFNFDMLTSILSSLASSRKSERLTNKMNKKYD